MTERFGSLYKHLDNGYRTFRSIIKNGFAVDMKIERRGRKKLSHAKWSKDLVARYGESIIDDMASLKKNPYYTLESVGKKYGVTREYVRLIYNRYHGEKYTLSVKKKNKEKLSELSCRHDPRNKAVTYKKNGPVYKGAVVEKLFANKCISVGLDIVSPCDRSADIVVNGWRVDVKSAYKATARPNNNINYYSYGVSVENFKTADFIAAYHTGIELFFIIPIGAIKNNGKQKSIFLRENLESRKKNNAIMDGYIEYINRFDQLFLPKK